MIKAVFFDVDGTLIDTTEYILQAFEHTLHKSNVAGITREDIIPLVGMPMRDMYDVLAPGIIHETLRQSHDEFQIKNLHLVRSFPQVTKTLKKLQEQNIHIAAITNRGTSTPMTLQKAGLTEYIDLVITRNDVINEKPHPKALRKALNYFGIEKDHAYMVGDTFVDIQAGKNAGVKTIGVTYGFGGQSIRESKPDHLIDSITEIATIIAKFQNADSGLMPGRSTRNEMK